MAKQIQVLMVPGYTNSGPGHWQSLWQQKHPEYQRVEQRDWNNPARGEWVSTLDKMLAGSDAGYLLVGHSLGCITIAHWAAQCHGRVHAALLVAPADVERPDAPAPLHDFRPIPLTPLPFASITVISSDDPYLSPVRGKFLAACWRSRLVEIGPCGHLDTQAGFGHWPRGELLLQQLLREASRVE